jgi:hypothetical protein
MVEPNYDNQRVDHSNYDFEDSQINEMLNDHQTLMREPPTNSSHYSEHLRD